MLKHFCFDDGTFEISNLALRANILLWCYVVIQTLINNNCEILPRKFFYFCNTQLTGQRKSMMGPDISVAESFCRTKLIKVVSSNTVTEHCLLPLTRLVRPTP